MKFLLLFSVFILFIACNQQSKNDATSKVSQSNDPCTKFARILNGAFAASYMEGTMVWTGGLSGSVEISGNDYNDMTCTYTVSDCVAGTVSMMCNNSLYDTQLVVYSPDSMLLGTTAYSRVK